MTIANPLAILQKVYGYDQFRDAQAEIIDHVLADNDAFVIMPTGGGKSLCYQIPALCKNGIGIVISPLIALMQNQVMALKELGVKAAAINSNQDYSSILQTYAAMRNNAIDLVYVSPERLLTDEFLALLQDCELALFAIDEAHCVSQWGHDFRPEYQGLHVLHEQFAKVPRLALTATADEATRNDIMQHLQLQTAKTFISGFDRPNIQYQIHSLNNPKQHLLTFINQHHVEDSGIVYCLSRAKVEQTAVWLTQQGKTALTYHAGMSASDRAKNQERFLREENIIMVATIAFGMGIDKSNVRFVAHLNLPKSIEAYYQETGRAGRDGLAANAWMAYSISDVAMQRHFIESSNSPQKQKRIEQQKLNAFLGLCETTRCRRQVLLEYFSDSCAPCENCDTCLHPVKTFDATIAVQKALSCVYRTDQIFGVSYLIDVLLGKDDKRIQQFHHDKLSTFGIGKEFNRAQWQSIFRQLAAHNLLGVNITGHGGLYITEVGKAFLKNKDTLHLREYVVTTASKPKTEKSRVEKINLNNVEDKSLFNLLREKRLALAKAQNLPPYIIFHDTTLMSMAELKPQNKEQMLAISGVGEKKFEKYGDEFLAVLKKNN
jgi:ATP-dependent DNA helicase RecQ